MANRASDEEILCACTESCLLWEALEQSVKLQSHYATLLNAYDGGSRLQFANAGAWLERLETLKKSRDEKIVTLPVIRIERF